LGESERERERERGRERDERGKDFKNKAWKKERASHRVSRSPMKSARYEITEFD